MPWAGRVGVALIEGVQAHCCSWLISNGVVLVMPGKLIFWESFQFGLAMLSISALFFAGVMTLAPDIRGEDSVFSNQRSLCLSLVVERTRHNAPKR
jgi:hypothetical protein